MSGFTGFPSRGGHFGIRRLNVSFGLGPQGFIVESAKGTPTSRGGEVISPIVASDVVAFLAQGASESPVAVLTPTGFVLIADLAAYLARAAPEHPLARGSEVGPSLAKPNDCEPQEARPRAKAGASLPTATTKAPKTKAKLATSTPKVTGASQAGAHSASSTSRKPSTKSSSTTPKTRKKR